MFIQFGLTLWEVGVSEGGMEGMDEMGFQVPVGHKDKGEWLEQQALWSKEWWCGLHKVPVQMSQELSWCMQGGWWKPLQSQRRSSQLTLHAW